MEREFNLSGVVVSIYLPENTTDPVYKGATDKNGQLKAAITIPASVGRLVIDPAYIGLIRNAQAVISPANSITATIGGKNTFSGDIVAEETINNVNTTSNVRMGKANRAMNIFTPSDAPTLAYPSPYTSSTEAIMNTTTYPFKLGRPKHYQIAVTAIQAIVSGIAQPTV